MRGGPDSHPGPREPASLELVHALLKAGVDANTQLNMLQPSRNGVLFFAVQSGRAAVVRFLLGHGASVNARGDSGDALLNAARNNAEVTNMLRTPISRGIAPVTR